VLIRFLRLMGKRLVEAVFDPEINLIFLAWDVIEPGYARKEWESYRDERSILDPAYTHRLKWRENRATAQGYGGGVGGALHDLQ